MPITAHTIAMCQHCGKTARGLKAITKDFGTRCEGRFPAPQSLCKPCRSADAQARREAKKKQNAKPKYKAKAVIGKQLTLTERYQLETGDTRKRAVQHMKKALGLA